MGDNFVKIDIDDKELKKKLDGSNIKMKSIAKKMMTKANAEVVKKAKKNARQTFKTKNNTLDDPHNPPILKSFKKWNSKRQDWVSYIRLRTLHGSALEVGYTSMAQKSDYLVFKINGEWKKVKSVTVAPKPFFKPAINSVYGTGEYKKIFSEVLEKELQKYFEKTGGKE